MADQQGCLPGVVGVVVTAPRTVLLLSVALLLLLVHRELMSVGVDPALVVMGLVHCLRRCSFKLQS